jgi:hypothetical protein
MLHVADPRAEKQLTAGFYPLFANGRWTGQTFSAILRPPPAASRRGALLVTRFGIPETSIDYLHSMQLSAAVNGVAVSPASYTKAGEYEYVREVPAAAFHGGDAAVEFTLDKAMPPHDAESRTLGVVVTIIGFEAR